MNIQTLLLNSFKTSNIRKNNKNEKKFENYASIVQQKHIMPSSSLMLAFMGGYSLNINQVFENISEKQFPPDIKEMLAKEVNSKSNTDKTLYDVHFEKYKDILDCYSLDELKEKYPEFQDVISVYDIDAKEGSFVDKFLNNKSEVFANNEDLTLQLIKLYWGQGFSLTDLSDYVAKNSQDGKGINLYYLMKEKLNIPFMNSRYAQILKLSNKEYNEQFTSQMSIKLREAKEAKEQMAQGEAVIIPRGELSQSHKKHISDSLKAYYLKNPEKIYDMSIRQKRFFEENPEKREEMSEIMSIAWNRTDEGQSVLKYLRKFIKKYNNSSIIDTELLLKEKLDDNKKTALVVFWQKNPWAKEKMSVAVKTGAEIYKKEKVELETLAKFHTIKGEKIVFNLAPTQIIKNIKKWAQEMGYDTEHCMFLLGIAFGDDDNSLKAELENNSFLIKSKKLSDKYGKNNMKQADLLASCLHHTLMKFEKMLKEENMKLPNCIKKDKANIEFLKNTYNFACIVYGIPTIEDLRTKNINSEYSIQQISNVYSVIMDAALKINCEELGEFMDKELDKSYEELQKPVIQRLF